MSTLSARQNTTPDNGLERYLKPGETVEGLYTRSVHEIQKWRKRRRWTLGLSWIGFFVGSFGLTSTSIFGQATPAISFLLVISALLGLLVGILMRPTRRNALNSLLVTDDLRAVGPLIEATQIMIPEITAQAADTLVKLLPRLREEHADLLTPLQRQYLRGFIAGEAPKRSVHSSASIITQLAGTLNLMPTDAVSAATQIWGPNRFMGCHSEALSIAVLQALARIGDSKDMELIQRIAANPVQQAALRAQAHLEARIKTVAEQPSPPRVATSPTAASEEIARPSPPIKAVSASPTPIRVGQEEPQMQFLSETETT